MRFIRVEFRKAVITQITSRYICAEQKSIRTFWTLRQMNNSWATCQVSVRLPDDSRNVRLQRSLETELWTTQAALVNLDFCWGSQMAWVRIWHRQHGSTDPASLVSTVQAVGGRGKGGDCFLGSLRFPLIQICYGLNATVLATCILSWLSQFTVF